MKQVMIDYIKKKKNSYIELYFPYCVAYYDDIIKKYDLQALQK